MKLITAGKPPAGHYSPAVVSGGMVYVSGVLSIDPETGARPDGGIEAEAEQALCNLERVLRAAGVDRQRVVMCRVYIPDAAYWDDVNRVYAAFFGAHRPARIMVPTRELHHGCLVEIEAVAEAV